MQTEASQMSEEISPEEVHADLPCSPRVKMQQKQPLLQYFSIAASGNKPV